MLDFAFGFAFSGKPTIILARRSFSEGGGLDVFHPSTKNKNCVHGRETTYFRALALSSALRDFTALFGMGRGGALSV